MEFISKSEKETGAVAQKVAEQVLASHFEHAAVAALVGDLGAGKTTFAKSFAKALGVKGRVLSPTFVIFRKYRLATSDPSAKLRAGKRQATREDRIISNTEHRTLNNSSRFASFYHVDAYRITDVKELEALGFERILDNPENIVLIEWADKIREVLPKDALWLEFVHGKTAEERTIAVKG